MSSLGRVRTLGRGRGGVLIAIAILVVGLVVTGVATLEVRAGIAEGERQRLRNDAEQTTALFATVGQSLQTVLSTGSAVALATDGRPEAFQRSISASLKGAPIITNATLLDLAGRKVRVASMVGRPSCSARAPPTRHAGRASSTSPTRAG